MILTLSADGKREGLLMEEAACSSARRPQPAAREGGLEGPAASPAEGMEEAPSSAFMPGCPCSLLGTEGDTVSLSLNRQRSHRGGFVPTVKPLGVAEPVQQRWKAARGALGCGCPFLCPSEPGQRTPKPARTRNTSNWLRYGASPTALPFNFCAVLTGCGRKRN